MATGAWGFDMTRGGGGVKSDRTFLRLLEPAWHEVTRMHRSNVDEIGVLVRNVDKVWSTGFMQTNAAACRWRLIICYEGFIGCDAFT